MALKELLEYLPDPDTSCRVECFTGEQVAGVTIDDRQRVAVVPGAESKLSLEVGRPDRIRFIHGSRWSPRVRRGRVTATTLLYQAVSLEQLSYSAHRGPSQALMLAG
jgi:hypothetical protein